MARFLEEEQIAGYRDCFNLYDKDRIGKISCGDLMTVMRSLGACPTTKEITAHLGYIDKELSHTMDFSQFLTVMHKQTSEENANDEMMKAFKAYDEKNTGFIDKNELKNILMNTGEKLDRMEVDAMFKAANVKAQKINYSDFVRLISLPVPDY